jgi:hypothetical protein
VQRNLECGIERMAMLAVVIVFSAAAQANSGPQKPEQGGKNDSK